MESNIKIGIILLLAQIIMLGMTLSFHTAMDRSAEKAGLTEIIKGN